MMNSFLCRKCYACSQMASIEVSLAGARRRSAGREIGRELDALRSALTDKDTLIQRYDCFQITIKT